ncbi:MAG: hypothetical protein L0220_05930 [Acidobacteria bacterium]|nr:hypothetical protein [Acidobacteriota bacterium]
MRNITVTDAKKIGTILDFVHDRTFELSKVRLDEKSRALSIPLTVISDETKDMKKVLFVKTWKNPVVEATLLIKNAINFSVKDEAQIDQGIINTIAQEGNDVLIKCSVPVEIRVEVTKLELELVLSDTVTSQKNRFAFG